MMDKRSNAFFEGWARHNGMTFLEKRDIGNAEILLADSNQPVEYRDPDSGVVSIQYVTAYCIRREGGNWIASWHTYDPIDYFGDTPETGRKRRMDEALKFAQQRVDLTEEVGLYDGYRL